MTMYIQHNFLDSTDKIIDLDSEISGEQPSELSPFIHESGDDAFVGMDEGAKEHFHNAGLLDLEGNIDWDAYAKVPCMPSPYDQAMSPSETENDTWREIFDTNKFPYRWCAYLLVTYFNAATKKHETYRGSAAMIGPHQVATVAHCISGKLQGNTALQWAEKVTVAFAQKTKDGKIIQPYGARQTTSAWVTVPWFHGGRAVPSEDWGLLEFNLKNPAPGRLLGYFGMRLAHAGLVGKTVALTGYPAAALGKEKLLGQWTAEGRVHAYTNGPTSWSKPDYEYQHLLPSSGGTSGGPLHYGTYRDMQKSITVENAYLYAVHSGISLSAGLACPVNSTFFNLVNARRKLSCSK